MEIEYGMKEKIKYFAAGVRNTYRDFYPAGVTFRENIYRTRRYMNIFGGLAIGSLGPAAAMRFMAYPGFIDSGNKGLDLLIETGLCASSLVFSIPVAVFTAPAGLAAGMMAAFQLDMQRKKKLEDKIEE